MAISVKIYVIGILIGCLLYAGFLLHFKRSDVSQIGTLIKQEYNISFPGDTFHWQSEVPLEPTPIFDTTTSSLPVSLVGEKTGAIAEQSVLDTTTESSIETEKTSQLPVILPLVDSTKSKCITMKDVHFVVPGSSWGSLNVEQQKQWTTLKCDVIIAEDTRADAQKAKLDAAADAAAMEPIDNKKKSSKQKKKRKGGNRGEQAGLPEISDANKEWCHETMTKYSVKPMKSWGSMPMNQIDVWKKRQCDLVFTGGRMGRRPLSRCLPSTTSTSKDKKEVNPNLSDKLPLIAIMAATTTRKVNSPSTSNMALFTYLLPSVVRSLDCGYRYEYVLGYDKGDPFYDSDEGMDEVRTWFKNNVEDPMAANGIRITLRLVRVNNTLKKPGPVFNEMARAAYTAGASYFYRVNDDTELLENWAHAFVTALTSLPAPHGALGPSCSQGNNKILTHDFTTRLHMEIFEMNYYPPELTDWWMDDWISLVYGQSRTFKANGIPVIHHTGAHGQRYTVDGTHEGKLAGLVVSGRTKIRQWMLKNGASETDLVAFDKDVYKAGFIHRDLPAASKRRKYLR